MIVYNTSKKQLTFIGILNGRDLILMPDQKSDQLIPNKQMLSKLIDKSSEDIKLLVSNSEELDMISSMDSRAINIVELG